MIYTAPCKMFWMRAYLLIGQVGGGWAMEFESFLGRVKWHRADRRVPFGAQKTRVRGVDPDPIRRVWIRIRIWILLSAGKNSKNNLDSYYFVTLFDFLSLKNDVNVPSKSIKKNKKNKN